MGARLGRTVHITRDDNTVVSLLRGDEVPADLAGYFVSENEVHRAFAPGSDSPLPAHAAAEGESAAEEPGGESDGYDALEYPELKALAKDRELPQSGKAKDLIARLREDDAERAAESEGAGDSPADEDDEIKE